MFVKKRVICRIGGLPQSLSGSETDVSTSNENLTNEDRSIRHKTHSSSRASRSRKSAAEPI